MSNLSNMSEEDKRKLAKVLCKKSQVFPEPLNEEQTYMLLDLTIRIRQQVEEPNFNGVSFCQIARFCQISSVAANMGPKSLVPKQLIDFMFANTVNDEIGHDSAHIAFDLGIAVGALLHITIDEKEEEDGEI